MIYEEDLPDIVFDTTTRHLGTIRFPSLRIGSHTRYSPIGRSNNVSAEDKESSRVESTVRAE